MLKAELDTPALILDLELFEENLIKMRDFAAAHGKKLRPHAKTHKCPEIAKYQMQMGNCAGICAAKLSEAEALAEAGIQDILITSPVVAPGKIARLPQLNEKISNLQLTVDSAVQVEALAAEFRGRKPLHVLIDVDPEMGRTGVTFDQAAGFGEFISRFPELILDGVQCYAGHLQHISSGAERNAESSRLMRRGAEVFRQLAAKYPTCRIYTGTGTGTSAADVLIPELTDIQVGSYCMMDSEYLAVEHTGPAYKPALTMLSSVISANHAGHATIDAGTKAVYVTPGAPAQVIKDNCIQKEFVYSWDFGDEHGHLTFPESTVLRPGDIVELIVSHCDPTVNLFDVLHVVKAGELVGQWQISLRGCCR